MGEVIKRISQLPATTEELQKFILIGKQVLAAHKAKLKAIQQATEAHVAQEAALVDTQDIAEILLYAEAKLGALIPKPVYAKEIGSPGRTYSLPVGVTKKQSHYAQELHRHRALIAEVAAEAREKGEIPVRAKVLKLIQERKPKPKTPPLPKGKYNVIYADPPWEYKNSGLMGAAEQHYPTMTIDELCKLPVCNLVALDAVLFMWVTNPLLAECLPLITAWGFEYKTNFCWIKEGRATYGKLGFYLRGQHELLLICVKGSMLPQDLPNSLIKSPKSKHSRKPDEVYGIIEKMYPKGKYIELFARQERKGWQPWGNEV